MLTFDPALRLYELALLAFTIHESNGMYTALKANCYFYAGVLMNVLRDHFRWRELHVAGSEAVEQANIQLRKKLSKDKAGTVCAGLNLAGNSDETAGIMVRYEETTKDFFKAVSVFILSSVRPTSHCDSNFIYLFNLARSKLTRPSRKLSRRGLIRKCAAQKVSGWLIPPPSRKLWLGIQRKKRRLHLPLELSTQHSEPRKAEKAAQSSRAFPSMDGGNPQT